MEDYITDYVAFVIEQVEQARQAGGEPLVLIEHRVDYSYYVNERDSFGTADVLIIGDDKLRLIDLKYGRHVVVSAEKNSQLMLYALGAISKFGFLYDFTWLEMSIYQPRADNFSHYVMEIPELSDWIAKVLRPAAALASAGEGEFKSGDWCQFCRVKNECRAFAAHALEAAKYAFRDPPLLTDDEIADFLSRVDDLVRWASSVKKFALQEAVSGKSWPGFKVCEGRSNRRYSDEGAVAEAARNAGFLDIYRASLLPLTEMEKKLGKRKFNKILGQYIIKPPGKPVLAPESDERPVMDTQTAAEAFADVDDDFEIEEENRG